MKIYVDIDDTICFYSDSSKIDYSKAIPNKSNINKINKLYNDNNYIIYWTARGTVFRDRIEEYEILTKKQFKDWGVLYHELIVGQKPAYDLLICDKTKRIEEI
tara:strand:+ start:714 stop:1022 length:309 start_codon:yes stop_codon:yes gene_type:complete